MIHEDEDLPVLSSIIPCSKQQLNSRRIAEFEACLTAADETRVPKLTYVLPDVGLIDDVLSVEECAELCHKIDEAPEMSFWSQAGKNADTLAFRNADTVELCSSDIAGKIWHRVSKLVGNLAFAVEEEEGVDKRWKMDQVGHWQASGMNQDLLFARYPSLGSFAPHTDGQAIHDFNLRSFYSVIIFLNDIPNGSGGGTKFYRDEAVNMLQRVKTDSINQWTADAELCLAEVDAVRGRLLFFEQNYVHEGVPPLAPNQKYIIRSDIMFRRTPALLDSTQDKEAYKVYQEAENLGEAGEVDASIKLFRKAFKMSPGLARILGQG